MYNVNKTKQVLESFQSHRHIAEALGISVRAVEKWYSNERISDKYAQQVCDLTDGLYVLVDVRPDLMEAYKHNELERIFDTELCQSEVARSFGISRQAVHKWVKDGYVPLKRASAVSDMLGGKYSAEQLSKGFSTV